MRQIAVYPAIIQPFMPLLPHSCTFSTAVVTDLSSFPATIKPTLKNDPQQNWRSHINTTLKEGTDLKTYTAAAEKTVLFSHQPSQGILLHVLD